MNSLKDIIQRCHQRHKKPLRQRKTRVTPALYKGPPYNFSVYCAWRYPIRLYELEQAGISFMPIGRAPYHDHGPEDFGGERFLKRQSREDWQSSIWHRSWGVQVYTGVPSARDDAQWHDIHFKYAAICNAPDAVLTCIDALVSAVANPMLTLTKSGGLRFSCRVQNYLHPNTNEAKQYIYKHIPTSENPHHRDVYLEIVGDKGYSRWDARYEILIGNLVNPPIIAKEVLFASIDTLRAALHQPAPSGETELEPSTQTTPTVAFCGSTHLNLARVAFLERGFSYVAEKDGIYHWSQPDSSIGDGHILLWERDDDVWVRTAIPDTGLPMEATRITDIWDDTGILPPVPTTGLPVTDEILAVREAKLSPLGIKRPSPVLRKQEGENRDYGTLEENAVHMQQVFNRDARILGLMAEAGGGKRYAAASYVLNDGVISLSAKSSLSQETEQRFQNRNVSSVAHRRTRNYLWEQVKEIPAEIRMATPFQHGNVCEDPKRCETLEKKGGNPNESICPQCPVYTECQQRGYLSQPTALKSVAAQILNPVRLFLDPRHSKYDGEAEFGIYKDERLQHVYEQNAVGLLSQIIGRTGLNRLPNKAIVLLASLPLPDITDRPETSLFDWEDFEVAGGLDQLPETIATRERFEAERDSLTAESDREKVEQVLGVSRSQANRILMKLRGGKPFRVPLRDQIFSQLANGEKKTAELIDLIDGHPGSIKNELKRLVDTGEIVKVRRSMYALPPGV
ncbi:hypothetical protein F4054_22435 [Candidatus Poribacteria bacterium]|nr:hypothetical protein [Candidatus Poribacteria bacterium]MYK25010.1 hypothetical protein [Candidatus Poribacteria bacterium]